MNKEVFCTILEAALFSFDGVSEKELIEKCGIKENLAKAGIKLCDYLKSIELLGFKNETTIQND